MNSHRWSARNKIVWRLLGAAHGRVFQGEKRVRPALGGQAHQPPEQRAEFAADWGAGVSGRNLFLQTQTAQRLATIRMRRPALRVVPGAGAAVAELGLGLVPSPQFDQRVQPSGDMKSRDVGEVMPELLLPQAVNFLEVMEVLLDDGPVRDGFEDLSGRGVGVGAEEGHPAGGFTDQDDA